MHLTLGHVPPHTGYVHVPSSHGLKRIHIPGVLACTSTQFPHPLKEATQFLAHLRFKFDMKQDNACRPCTLSPATVSGRRPFQMNMSASQWQGYPDSVTIVIEM